MAENLAGDPRTRGLFAVPSRRSLRPEDEHVTEPIEVARELYAAVAIEDHGRHRDAIRALEPKVVIAG
jgi:hypothetical protein